MPVTGFFHAGITVRDMDVSLRFYRDALGLNQQFDKILDADYLRTILAMPFESIRAVYLDIPGGGVIELLEYRGLERMSAQSRPADYGAGHLCLYVKDIQAVADALIAAGGTPRSDGPVLITAGPNEGSTGFYLHDPDGYAVELFERASA
jgi:catechol 2,3-dioxygenase-like lactoylglutathione lyase family enzyme